MEVQVYTDCQEPATAAAAAAAAIVEVVILGVVANKGFVLLPCAIGGIQGDSYRPFK